MLNNFKKLVTKSKSVRRLTSPNRWAARLAQNGLGFGQKEFAKLPIGPQHL
jgi:hypothetical protein